MSSETKAVPVTGIPRLDDGTKRYYNRVESSLDNKEEEEDRGLFYKNVMKQVCEKDGVVCVCCDKDGSRVIERLLKEKVVDQDSMKNFLDGILADFCQMSKNKCGSHVVEVVLKSMHHNLSESESDVTEKFYVLCRSLTAHVQEFIVHPYASHVISSLVQAVSGVHLGDLISRSRQSQEFRKVKMSAVSEEKASVSVQVVPDSFSKLLLKIHKTVYKSDILSSLLTHKCSSPVVQILLRVLTVARPEKVAKLIKKISKEMPSLIADPVGSHLMETVIEVASSEVLETVYESCFKGQMMNLALHSIANYIVQKLLSVSSPEQVPTFVDELSPLEEVLFAGHTGVVVKLVEAAIACPQQQYTVLQLLLTAFHAQSQSKYCVSLFLSMTAYEVYKEENKDEYKVSPITLHGSLIVQALLKYQDTKLVARSLLKMTLDDTRRISCDPTGSHVFTMFMSSTTVSAKNKMKMISKLEADLVCLTKDKHGSRVVDSLWRNCEIGHKDQLAQKLLTHEEELLDNFYGQIVLRNCNITHYKRKQAVWIEQERAAEKKRMLFDDLIGEDLAAPKKKLKKV